MPSFPAHPSIEILRGSTATRRWMVCELSGPSSFPMVNLENFVSFRSTRSQNKPHADFAVSDATVLLRDIAGDAAQNAANRVNPSKDQLAQIDRPADDNTWHDVPDMSRDNLKNQMRGQVDKQKPFSRSDMRDAAGDATQAAHPSGSRDPNEAADLAARDQRYGTDSGVDAQSGARAGMQNLQDRASQNVPEETKDRARQAAGQTKGYLQDKFPQERRDQTVHRLKKMIVEIQGHPDCKSQCDHVEISD